MILKYMANNIFEQRQKSGSSPRRGPKVRIDDNQQLWGDRDQLVGQLENNWHDIGGKLASIKKPADVVSVFGVLVQNNPAHVVRILLRPTSKPADGALLHKARYRVGELNAIRMESWEYKKECLSNLEAAENVGKRDLSEGDKVLVEEERVKRVGKLAQAEKEFQDATARQTEAEQMLADGETYFARDEIIDFCRSHRYTLNPLNTANALAGLTRVGWRRSIELCQKEEPVNANKGRIQIFNSILRMVRSCTRKSDLLKHAERWLRHAPVIKSQEHGVSELRDNWFYLLWAIKDTLKAKVRSRDLPFAITQEYWKRKENVTDVERFLAEGERIVV